MARILLTGKEGSVGSHVFEHLTAYGNIANLRGCDIDKPRNLAKSVTVE